ncbi:MAG: sensor histidine kinase, partial [Phaeodactylibacter sp.]|nr:sensor histidine kinase [Phaeodactylibacter sp.]
MCISASCGRRSEIIISKPLKASAINLNSKKLKNPTPQQIAVSSSIWLAGGVAVILLVFWLLSGRDAALIFLPVIGALILFTVSYFTTIHYLKKYIYRKIKLIYKTIHKHKVRPEEKSASVDIRTDIISEVEKEVAQWVDDQAQEIRELKNWQEYRRRFLGDISHELKTPIFNIQGYLETLLDGGMEDPKINRTYVERAVKNVERLNTIVEDLEAISRMEAGELILEMQTFDIRELVEEVFEDLEIKAAARKIELSFKAGAEKNYRVRADRESIRQVMMNLVNNSVKYGKENGQTKVGFYDMDRYLLVEVADNGIGISKEHLTHIFERF